MEEFITYGIIFKKEKFNRIRNCGFLNKPKGGLWCSPVKCEYSWRRWCENEDFHTERLSTYTRFRLKEGSKIYEIRTLEDWDKLIKNYSYQPEKEIIPDWCIDFESLEKAGYQGCRAIGDIVMDLRYDGRGTMTGLNAWDCESMVIFDYSIIEILEEKRG